MSVSTPSISPMMKALDKEALARARIWVQKKVGEQSNVTELSDLRAAAAKELAISEAQLNGAVQGKLDALKRSVDLMEESTMKLTGFTETMNDVELRIQKTNTHVVTYPHIRRIQNSRDNLNKVIAQVESFLNVPNRVAELRALLLDNPDRIKDVFLEALQLEAWRRSLKTEINFSREKKIMDAKNAGKESMQQRTASGQLRNRKQSTVDEYSVDMLDAIDKFVDKHLGIILKLSTEVKNVIFGNIERLFDTAAENPEELVSTFEIIEMHQQYLDRRLEQSLSKASRGESRVDPDVIGFEDLREQAARRLKVNLEQKIQAWFIISLQESKDKEGGVTSDKLYHFPLTGEDISVKMLLTAALDIMKRIHTFREQVIPCIPPNYNPLDICMTEFERQLMPYINELLADISKLDVYDLVQLVDWFDYFLGQMAVFELTHRTVCLQCSQMTEDLMTQYLFTIKAQVMEWFGNIKKQPVEVVRSTEGILITSTPEDMFNIIHMQIAVAKERLSRDHLKDVVNSCLQVLREVQRQSYDALQSGWREMNPELLCAMVNDTHRMQEKSEEFADTTVKLIPKEYDREMLTVILEEVSSEYINIAIKAVNILARCVLEDLEEPAFSKLFKGEWESGDAAVSSIVVATLLDYWTDISEWLPEYFFAKFVHECLFVTVQQYVMCLRRYPPGSLQFVGELSAAKRIFDDMEIFFKFFSEHIDVLHRGGLRSGSGGDLDPLSPLTEALSPMSQLARVISATHFSGAQEEATALFERWGSDGLQLVQCAISSNPGMDKLEKAENLEAAERAFNKQRYTTEQQCDIYRTVEGSLTNPSDPSSASKFKRIATSTTAKEQVSKLSGWKFRTTSGAKGKDSKK